VGLDADLPGRFHNNVESLLRTGVFGYPCRTRNVAPVLCDPKKLSAS